MCEQLVELVGDLLDGASNDIDRRRLTDHLAGCDGCTVYTDQIRAVLRLTAHTGPDRQLPEPVVAALLARFRTRRPPHPSR